jgi:hypothetical protein
MSQDVVTRFADHWRYKDTYTANGLRCLHTSMAGEVDRLQRREHLPAHPL